MKEFQKNDIVVIKIEDCGIQGEGIGKIDGFTLFVKDAIPGDEVEVKIMKLKKNYAFAKLEKVLTPSPNRVDGECTYNKSCGGCQIQSMQYAAQLQFKESKVKNNLQRVGKFSAEEVEAIMRPIVGMENPYRYRNKALFPFGTNKEGETVTGFYAGGTHSIISNTDCALGIEENEEILNHILSFMKKTSIKPYDEGTKTGLVRHALIRKGFSTGQIMVCLVINGKTLPQMDLLIQSLQEVKGMQSISYSSNFDDTNVVMGKKAVWIWGTPYIEDKIGDILFQISPLSFYQVNPVQTEKLYSYVLEYAALTGKETVWDLYCGIGTISLFLSKAAKKVYGVEIVNEAIKDAKKNAKINTITNAEFFVGKVEEVLPQKWEEEKIKADVFVIDPPRKGIDEYALATILEMKPKRIVYVSCDSATLARDLRILCDGGYTLEKVQPVDMFPHTVHVETVILMTRCGQNDK